MASSSWGIQSGGIVKNRSEIASSLQRSKVIDIIEAGIAAVLPDSIMHSSVAFDVSERMLIVEGRGFRADRMFVVGGGKASGAMAAALEDIISPGRITAGIVSDKYGTQYRPTSKIDVRTAGHPVPDERGVETVGAMLALKDRYSIGAGDLVICLISGGGSALMPAPVEGVSLAEKQRVTRLLLECGAEIAEINCVRKHISLTKGGRLGRFFAPATVVSLILSDVIGNDLSTIASGPTYPDPSTFTEALAVLERYSLVQRVPASVLQYLKDGAAGRFDETPKRLDNCHNFIIGDSSIALQAMAGKAARLGLRPLVVTAEQKGDTSAVAESRASEIASGKYRGHDVLLIGGETTPRLPEKRGRGGRNQHYVAVSMLALGGLKTPWVVASVGSDGSDFLPDVAGAIADRSTLEAADRLCLPVARYIGDFDSYGLFSSLPGSFVETGNTGTNVGDLIVYLLG